jgi:hypothetical protein
MRLPKRRTIWLSAASLLAILLSAWFLLPRGRITQQNFDRIQIGMTLRQVEDILGADDDDDPLKLPRWVQGNLTVELRGWSSGPNDIVIIFDRSRNDVVLKQIYLAPPWETLTWYAKKGAEKIGVKWE